MYLTRIYTRLEKYLKKMPIWFNIIIVLAILFVIVSIYKETQPVKEGFIDQTEKFVEKTGLDLYDDFYVNIYDQLFYTELANQYEIGSIQNITKPTSESNVLIIGSGTGKTANTFEKEGINVTGLDRSSAMVKYAKDTYPKINFIVGDPLKSMTVQSSQYTDIICLNMEIYKYKDKTTFIQNVYNAIVVKTKAKLSMKSLFKLDNPTITKTQMTSDPSKYRVWARANYERYNSMIEQKPINENEPRIGVIGNSNSIIFKFIKCF